MNTQVVRRPSAARLSIGAFIVVASWLVGFALMSGDLRSLVHASSAIIVAAGPTMFALLSRSNGSWQTSHRSSRATSLGNATLASGVIGTIIGLIHVMENLDKPDQIGVGIAAAMMAILYGMGANFLFTASAEQSTDHTRYEPQTDIAFYGMVSVTMLIAATFVILYALNLSS